jgi:hypothetical protein
VTGYHTDKIGNERLRQPVADALANSTNQKSSNEGKARHEEIM